MALTQPRSAYVHVPFCRRRCGYCNFAVSLAAATQAENYLQALACELQQLAGPHPVDTLFLGGGTPTQLTPAQIDRLFQLIYETLPPDVGAEVCVEANPEDIDPERCAVLRAWGVNRVSLGVQSFHKEKLRLLERSHDLATVHQAVGYLRDFCDNLSLDLIFAAPGETPDAWDRDLQMAWQFQPQHVSTYGLTYERGTTFWGRKLRGVQQEVDEELQRVMYESSIDFWLKQGYEHYEVSNFALPGYRCRHNQVYWLGASYFALGPGAARYVDGQREVNHRSTSTYIQRMLTGRSPVAESERLTPREVAREAIVLRMRMREGVAMAEFEQQYGFSIDSLLGSLWHDFQQRGLWETVEGRLRLTRAGLLVSDSIWSYVLAPEASDDQGADAP